LRIVFWLLKKRKCFDFVNTNWTPLILPKGTNEKAVVLIEAGGFYARFYGIKYNALH